MKIIVVYKSKTGFTEKYAKWIADELSCSTKAYADFELSSIHEYDLILFGSRVHAGKVDGLQEFIQLCDKNGGANLVLFATGGTAAKEVDVIDKMWKQSLPKKAQHDIPHFYMPGGLDYEKMGTADRLIMRALAKMLGGKKEKPDYDLGCEQAIQNSYDASAKEYIIPLIQHIKTVGI